MPCTYLLPDGTTTESENLYDAKWVGLASAIKDITGLRIADYDPGVTLCTYDKKTIINLPVWFLEAFNKGLGVHDWNIKYMEHCTCGKTKDDGMTMEELGIETYEPHPCPLKVELEDDSKTLCTCCPYCESQCKEDI